MILPPSPLGFSIKLPVQLGGYPPESPNKEIQKIYSDFFKALTTNIPGSGTWNLVDAKNPLIIYYWKVQSTYILVICNYSVYNFEDIIDLNIFQRETEIVEKIIVETIFSRKNIIHDLSLQALITSSARRATGM